MGEENNIIFFYEGVEFELLNPDKYKDWLLKIAIANSKVIGEINYIFCDDKYLHEINLKYLDHDTYTDIITFPYNYDPIEADIYISLERVKDNAITYKISWEDELQRVIVHGLLHLMGFDDKTEKDKIEMRRIETESIALIKNLNKQNSKMEEKKKSCIICQVTSDDMPLINFDFKGEKHYICSQHIPVLIHKSGSLQEILPGMKNTD